MPISPAAILSPTAARTTPYSCGPTSAIRPNGGFISGKYNEVIYIVGSSNPATWQQQKEFAAILESVREGPLPYRAESSLPFGTAWNTAANYGQYKSCGRWAEEQPGVCLATTIEIPYANVGAAVVTADNARVFGRDLARAIRRYLESGGK